MTKKNVKPHDKKDRDNEQSHSSASLNKGLHKDDADKELKEELDNVIGGAGDTLDLSVPPVDSNISQMMKP